MALIYTEENAHLLGSVFNNENDLNNRCNNVLV